MNEGTKFDNEKLRMELLDFDALEGLADALTYGAVKYGDNNWRGGIDNSRLIGALLRHLSAYMRGEDTDPETGVSHIDHVGANWMFLSSNTKLRPELDNRWCSQSERSCARQCSETCTSNYTVSGEAKNNVSLEEMLKQFDDFTRAQEAWKDTF